MKNLIDTTLPTDLLEKREQQRRIIGKVLIIFSMAFFSSIFAWPAFAGTKDTAVSLCTTNMSIINGMAETSAKQACAKAFKALPATDKAVVDAQLAEYAKLNAANAALQPNAGCDLNCTLAVNKEQMFKINALSEEITSTIMPKMAEEEKEKLRLKLKLLKLKQTLLSLQ